MARFRVNWPVRSEPITDGEGTQILVRIKGGGVRDATIREITSRITQIDVSPAPGDPDLTADDIEARAD